MNLRQLAYGLLSYLPIDAEILSKGTGGTGSARYCYCIWLSHLVLAHQGGMAGVPRVVAELGPGDSIGVGLAALLSGAHRYIAVDAVAHAERANNLRVFDELVALFRARTAIPGKQDFPEVTFPLRDLRFPGELIGEESLRAALSDERVAMLRRLVGGDLEDRSILDYRSRRELRGTDAESLDMLLSNAVMEHVPELMQTYSTTAQWLKPGGWASHQIDFRSHGLFRAWDGHWACPDWLWACFKGRRAYLLNREPLSVHRVLARANGFEEVRCERTILLPETKRLSARFAQMDDIDRSTAGVYVLLRKPE